MWNIKLFFRALHVNLPNRRGVAISSPEQSFLESPPQVSVRAIVGLNPSLVVDRHLPRAKEQQQISRRSLVTGAK
ncbi:hypothetical protein QN277_016384 [Acacia crassicarpa]|uniref:Uncharacterized protein n=1 Tax=Acacia crassicarpa TaxID=499986 RepID=A0AAE1MWH4_9FABA|nr:hypothetical protein QN277_016384 [Acacia crassicarpa]